MSLQHNVEVSLPDQLSAAVSNERVTATFACGGEIPIAGDQDTNTVVGLPQSATAVSLYLSTFDGIQRHGKVN